MEAVALRQMEVALSESEHLDRPWFTLHAHFMAQCGLGPLVVTYGF